MSARSRWWAAVNWSCDGITGTGQSSDGELVGRLRLLLDRDLLRSHLPDVLKDEPVRMAGGLRLLPGLHIGLVNPDAETVTGETVETAGRIASKARIDQILASSLVIDQLPKQTLILSRAMPDLGSVLDGTANFGLAEVDWLHHDEHQRKYGVTFDATPSQFLTDIERLCVRYHGNAFLVDEKSPFLTLGRDPSSKLVIADRKASRTHGRIERRNNCYYYVDSSTNGSYVASGGQAEVMVRRKEIELKGNGRIAFGVSLSDPKADFADFEHL